MLANPLSRDANTCRNVLAAQRLAEHIGLILLDKFACGSSRSGTSTYSA
jgi:hypothetical protein